MRARSDTARTAAPSSVGGNQSSKGIIDMDRQPTAPAAQRHAFTLIELLVVISIIALLIGILLPALGSARAEARSSVCASNARSVVQAMAGYLAENKDLYPASYLYASELGGASWTWVDQQGTDPSNGYIHWSYHLFNNGDVSEDSFECPDVQNGGSPATNPHSDATMPGQTFGAANPTPDRQARWLAYTANAAIVPRNKFWPIGSTNPRVNEFVKAVEIIRGSDTILATEFNRNWQAMTDVSEGDSVSKSHRPVNPFQGVTGGTGNGIYSEPNTGGVARYRLGTVGELESKDVVRSTNPGNLFTSPTELNVVGRHHPGGDEYGGTANFSYVDGHVERKTVAQTITEREWGDRHYSITGFDGVQ